ncbi:MAG TPA: DUF1501 domain-containing protein [Gemmataceae bacterium]|nr:DUF1501 domain-containing protein [Gemmataceae bacterium]
MAFPLLPRIHGAQHRASSRGNPLLPPHGDLLRVGSRRWFLQTGLAGLAGLTFTDMLRVQGSASQPVSRHRDPRSVILFWLSGGPSHIDTWDPKPDAPAEVRGPYRTIPTSVPGIRVCEHLPLQAQRMHKLTIIRSVDCSASNHTPITMQAGNALARRTNDGKDGGGYPSMGSVAAKFRGPNAPAMPAFVGLADSWKADVWGAGHMGSAFEPVKGNELPGRLAIPAGLNVERLQERTELRRQFDRLERELDAGQQMGQMDRYAGMALDMVISPAVRRAFDIAREPDRMRDAYGRCSVGEKALLARRLVEAGTTFVLVSGRWGYFDHHGDKVPPWGGIQKGLTPILPTIDRALTALIDDLEARGLLSSTLVLMLGEFGRGPVLTKDGGREHWLPVMSMLAAGGGAPHGQVIGSTDARGGTIKSRKVTPSDLAATVFQHLGIPLDAQWTNPQGRPVFLVTGGGAPLPELS